MKHMLLAFKDSPIGIVFARTSLSYEYDLQ